MAAVGGMPTPDRVSLMELIGMLAATEFTSGGKNAARHPFDPDSAARTFTSWIKTIHMAAVGGLLRFW